MTAPPVPAKFPGLRMLRCKPASLLLALAVLAASPAATPVASAETLNILVVRERGVGTPSLVQPYLDRFVANAAARNEWSDAKGQYYQTRGAAEEYIAAQKPHYAILSLPTFLDFRLKYSLEVMGMVDVSLAGGQQYFLVSRTATDLAGCKGRKLASDHAVDKRFVETVVARGAWTLADFELVPTQRPLQTIKEVLAGRADCALIDDAQMADMAKVTGAADVKAVWNSDRLPPMVVAAFPSAPTAERLRFQKNFDKVCDADTRPACAEVGIQSLKLASAADYAAVVAAYGN